MDYVKEYRSFVSSYYVSEGVRITAGLTMPAILLNYLGDLPAGIIMSLGACCPIFVDNAGPIHHRRNAMLVCDLIIFLVALATGAVANNPLLLGILIFLVCFSLSMLGVYGNRASSVGLAGLFVMVLQMDRGYHGWELLTNACYLLAGGLWYTLLSLLLYSVRPFRLAQQAIGECIQSTADYLRIRSLFYKKDADRDVLFSQLLKQQVSVNEKHDLIRELLFKSRDIVKDSTPIGRMLIIIFQDMVDLFEVLISAPQMDERLHPLFDDTGILEKYKGVIDTMAEELEEIGIAIKRGKPSEDSGKISKSIAEFRSYFEQFRLKHLNTGNMDGFSVLRKMVENLEDIGARFPLLHTYTSYDNVISKPAVRDTEYRQFVKHQELDPKLLFDQLSLRSNIFRHSLRIAIATCIGYIVSTFFPFGHGYWILLTIVVILKPTYSLTKKRNNDRLLGTVAGAGIGILLLYFIKNKDGLFLCMIICMVGAYSFMRTRYMIFVLLMTPYILLLFYLLNPVHFSTVIIDRILDTAIGSGIAWLANSFILPAWEYEYISDYLLSMAKDNRNYFLSMVLLIQNHPVDETTYRLSRKHAFVSFANLSDAFNRMLSEPKRKQKNIRELNQIVVLHQLLIFHIATLSINARKNSGTFDSHKYQALIDGIATKLQNVELEMENKGPMAETAAYRDSYRLLNQQLTDLLESRKSEIERGMRETETRKKLIEFKGIADELNFLATISSELEKKTAQFNTLTST
ncbi:MAG: FUSC family membrane protein [Chitinophagales bacterium]